MKAFFNLVVLVMLIVGVNATAGDHGATSKEPSNLLEQSGIVKGGDDIASLREYLKKNSRPVGFWEDFCVNGKTICGVESYYATLAWIGSFLHATMVDLKMDNAELIDIAIQYRNVKELAAAGKKSDVLWDLTIDLYGKTGRLHSALISELAQKKYSKKVAIKEANKKIATLKKQEAYYQGLLKSKQKIMGTYSSTVKGIAKDVAELKGQSQDRREQLLGKLGVTHQQMLDAIECQKQLGTDEDYHGSVSRGLRETLGNVQQEAEERADKVVSKQLPKEVANDLRHDIAARRAALDKMDINTRIFMNDISTSYSALLAWEASDDIGDLSAKEQKIRAKYQVKLNKIQVKEADAQIAKDTAQMARDAALKSYNQEMLAEVQNKLAAVQSEITSTKQFIVSMSSERDGVIAARSKVKGSY